MKRKGKKKRKKKEEFFFKLKIEKVTINYGWPNICLAHVTCWVGAWV
jgi:hypothetical protein